MDLKEYKTTKMKDPAFKKAYEEMQPELNVIRAIVGARVSHHLTQKRSPKKPALRKPKSAVWKMGQETPASTCFKGWRKAWIWCLRYGFCQRAKSARQTVEKASSAHVPFIKKPDRHPCRVWLFVFADIPVTASSPGAPRGCGRGWSDRGFPDSTGFPDVPSPGCPSGN